MQRLAAFDQVFYKAEQYHVASLVMSGVTVLAPARPRARLDAEAIAGHLAARMERIPLLRMTFVQDPLRLGRVHRVEDPHFDISEHIEIISVPAPGGYSALMQCVAGIVEKPLSVSQLWRWSVIRGLAGGRLAILCRLHHVLADGVGAAQALMAMYDRAPVAPERVRGDCGAIPELPRAATLLGTALAESARRWSVKWPRFVFAHAGPLLAALRSRPRDADSTDAQARQTLPRPAVKPTSLNARAPSNRRAIAYRSLPRAEIRQLARHFDCTVNDIGLLLYSFALQHYFAASGERVDFDLCCGMPISTRTEASAEGGNRATFGTVSLHNTVSDAAERLAAIRRETAATKQLRRPAEPLVDIEEIADLVPPALLDAILYLEGRVGLLRELFARKPTLNVVLSNVPGPAEPLCVGNAVVVENIPLIPLLDVIGLSGGISSSADFITIGFHCYRDIVKDPDDLARGVDEGLAMLRAARDRTEKRAGAKRRSRSAQPHPSAAKESRSSAAVR